MSTCHVAPFLLTQVYYRSVGGKNTSNGAYLSFTLTFFLSLSGIRASLYNAITEEQTEKLVDYIREFYLQAHT